MEARSCLKDLLKTRFATRPATSSASSRGGGGDAPNARIGVGQLTTFNQLGFPGVSDKPDGWWLPSNAQDTALILEVKSSSSKLGKAQVDELLKNVRIAGHRYPHVVGVLYNGESVRVFKNSNEYTGIGSDILQNVGYYLSLFKVESIDKEQIYGLTMRINDRLHVDFGIKNLYHRMIFTACALVAKRYGALMVEGMGYSEFHNAILNTLNKELYRDLQQNQKLSLLSEVFAGIKMNLNVNSDDEKEQEHVKTVIAEFIGWITQISDCLNSDAWRGEDVMGIFFNEFNRYKKKSDSGQVFTPEHITDFMYRIIEVGKDDRVLDAACGSGGFLIKAMANMICESGGPNTDKAKAIKRSQLFGIEYDREIYALACANMMIHKDGKTNLEQMDSREASAGEWIRKQGITKVLMNPPFETKYGCLDIVENVMDNVPQHTDCAFILPDKKLEKGRGSTKRILSKNRLKKIVKLPEDLFFGVSNSTSIFIFESGVPQAGNQIFACYMESDGLVTVKNKGRHDVYRRWPEIEDRWVDVVGKQSGDESCQWLDPSEHLSYQLPVPPIIIRTEDFRRSALSYALFVKQIDSEALEKAVLDSVLYSGTMTPSGDAIAITLPFAGGESHDSRYIRLEAIQDFGPFRRRQRNPADESRYDRGFDPLYRGFCQEQRSYCQHRQQGAYPSCERPDGQLQRERRRGILSG